MNLSSRPARTATHIASIALLAATIFVSAVARADAAPGIATFTTEASTTDAGGRADLATRFALNEGPDGKPDGRPRSVVVDLPPGVIGNPNAVPQCSQAIIGSTAVDASAAGQGLLLLQRCPQRAQVGVADIYLEAAKPPEPPLKAAIFNVERAGDDAGRLLLAANGAPPIYVSVSARTAGDYGLQTVSAEVDGLLNARDVELEVWAVPGAHTRGGLLGDSIPPDPPGERRAFLANPTVCDEPKLTSLGVTFHEPLAPEYVATSTDPTPTNCGAVPFDPSISLDPTDASSDAASGLDAKLSVPQSDDPDGLATSHLRLADVVLPEGVSVNPSAAAGLQACSDEQFGFGSNAAAQCPDASKVGTVWFDTPVLPGPLEGDIYLGEPLSTDPGSGKMLRLFQYARGFGLTVKIPGYAKADPQTGRLTGVFGDLPTVYGQVPDGMLDGLPQVPFTDATLRFKGGPRGLLAMPQSCGAKVTNAVLTPWSEFAGGGGLADSVGDSFEVGGDCSFGFAPSLVAGMDDNQARGSGTFAFQFSRKDGEQWLAGLTAELPDGLLAKVRGVSLCTGAQADAGACPAASRIGTVDAAAGSGSPFVLERKGEVFLTEGYKGGAYGLAAKVRPVAGPFRGAMELSPIVVRQAVHVDRSTAKVTVVSDPFPTIHHGIPLRVRSLTVEMDRPAFMRNPADCDPKLIAAAISSARGTVANVSTPFQASGCAKLAFKPRLAMRLTGRNQTTTGKHPGVRATVTQNGVGEAGIERARVVLPKSLALDPENAQALCEFEAGTKPDLENHCPRGSVVGRARAVSPLLNKPLAGDVYFVKNVERNPKTGAAIRKLPMIVVALRGEIAINLTGKSDTTKDGLLVNTFAQVPDAPISRFNLNIKGGDKGILAVTRTRRAKINLCDRPKGHVAQTDMDGHNGRRHDFDTRVKTPCAKAKTGRRSKQ